MYELEKIAPASIPAAMERAEHYRLTGESASAESICLDVLEVEPENQQGLILLLLSRTDQFTLGLPGQVERSREILPRLSSAYDRAYYGGIICERQGKYQLRQRGRRSGFVAWEWFQHAMEQYQEAKRLRQPANDNPILRWNTCARLIMRNPHCIPDPEEHEEHMIE